MFDAGKTRMIGLCRVKKLSQYVKPLSSDTGTSWTDGQICYINIGHQLLTRNNKTANINAAAAE